MALKITRTLARLASNVARVDAKEKIRWLVQSGLFDPDYYLREYPDIARAGVDPARHFVENGWKERRNPNQWFDTNYYLAKYTDVAKAGVDPLLHFDEHGWREFRQPSDDFDTCDYFIRHVAILPKPMNPLAHYLQFGRNDGLEIRGAGELSAGDLRRIAATVEAIIADQSGGSVSIERLKLIGNACIASGLWRSAEKVYQAVVAVEDSLAQNHWVLGACQARQQKWWQVHQSMSRAVALDGSRLDWLIRLVDVQERMHAYLEAEATLGVAIELSGEDANLHYRLGYVRELLGNREGARKAYAKALLFTDDSSAKKFGIGTFHQRRGLWIQAQKEYILKLRDDPLNGGLHYRLGFTHDRLYNWVEAENAYISAIGLVTANAYPQWHYRLGYVRERQGRFDEAAKSYGAAIALSEKFNRFWQYRLGYCLEKAGDVARACDAYAAMWPDLTLLHPIGSCNEEGFESPEGLSSAGKMRWLSDDYFGEFDSRDLVVTAYGDDMTSAERHSKIGAMCLKSGDFDSAIDAYRAALERSEDFHPTWYFRLGHALAAKGHLHEACASFRQTRILQRAHGCSEAVLRNDAAFAEKAAYLEYRDCLPLSDTMIVYESFSGNSLTCTPLAMLRALLQDPRYSSFLHVVVLNDKERVPDDLRTHKQLVFIRKYSDGYLRAIASAKYLINNSGFPSYFIRRDNQKYLNSWHGTPLKTLGKEQRYKFYDHKRTQRNFLQATHLITPNPHTTSVTLDSYDIRQLATAKLAEIGYPRIDLTLNASDDRKMYLRERLGLGDERKVVLYAPTWRGTPDDAQFDVSQLEKDLARLTEQECHILFRGHNFLESLIDTESLQCAVVPADIDTNELLSIVDVLITDYSSIFFDFFPTDRPVIYYVYDQQEYEIERGLYFSMDDMPGYKCHDIDELVKTLGTALREGIQDTSAHKEALSRYNLHDDGKATRRAIEFFFEDSDANRVLYQVEGRQSVILEGGSFEPGSITDGFVKMVSGMNTTDIDVVVAFAPYNIEYSTEKVSQFRRLPQEVLAVPRYGKFPQSIEDRFLKGLYESGQPINPVGISILRRAFGREFQRTFGFKDYSTTVCFSGYDAFATSILVGNDLPMRKVIHLHDDMDAQYKQKNPELGRIFRLYGMADVLVSFSVDVENTNKKKLTKPFDLREEQFRVAGDGSDIYIAKKN